MKIKILLTILLIVITGYSFLNIWAIPTGTPFKIFFVLEQNGIPVTGEEANSLLGIQRNSDGYWYDFDDSTFKNASWTTQNIQLLPDNTNTEMPGYYYLWTPPEDESVEEVYFIGIKFTGSYAIYKVQAIAYYQVTFKGR